MTNAKNVLEVYKERIPRSAQGVSKIFGVYETTRRKNFASRK